ncbi:MAG: hypothetical protein HYT62_01530 [Candidatus Yanofskybacteria bacterium]|nr:hypothetical protein [Candidatus Yanofskybacteria bacterium]
MFRFYENIEAERDRIQKCIQKFGWTSDHNLDWFCDSVINEDGKPVFVEFSDGTGLLTHKYPDKWRIWSDPLCDRASAPYKISEFCDQVLADRIKEVWCDDISDGIYPELQKNKSLKLDDIYYSLYWPVLEMEEYNPALPGGHFKDIRTAKSKFYREHKVEVIKTSDLDQDKLLKVVDSWLEVMIKKEKEDVYGLKYRMGIKNNFRGFTTARAMVVDGRPVGFNAGYEVPNHSGRFTSVIGLHDYSVKDLGVALYLEDLDWVKNAGYKEFDLQGSEYGKELRVKEQYGAKIERKTDTFSIVKK